MKYKNDFRKDDELSIESYNYEEINGFSQETAVDSINSLRKKDKLLTQINGESFEIVLENYSSNEHYSNQEDEWVEIDTVLANDVELTIKDIKNDKIIYHSENSEISDEMKSFIDDLIKKAKEKGVGCTYSPHLNTTEDDFAIIYHNRTNLSFATSFNDRLFLNEAEEDAFNQYLSIKDKEDAKQFLVSYNTEVEKKIKSLIEDYEISFLLNETKTIEELEEELNEYKKEKETLMKRDDEESYYEINDLDYLIDEKNNHIELLKESKEIENELLKYISKSELDALNPNNSSDFEDEDIYDEMYYDSPNAVRKPESLSDRFEGLKDFINLQVSKEGIPELLHPSFGIENKNTDKLKVKRTISRLR